MTMFPAHRQNLRKKDSFGGYGGACRRYLEGEGDQYDDDCCFMSLGDSDLMAEDESRTEISNNNNNELLEAEGSSSKDNINIIHQQIINKDEDDDGGWLQLSLGSQYYQRHQIPFGPRLVELDLLPPPAAGGGGGGGESSSTSQQLMMRPLTLTAPSSAPQQQQQLMNFQLTTAAPAPAASLYSVAQQYDYLAFRPNYSPPLTSTTLSSFSLPLPLPLGRRPLVHFQTTTGSLDAAPIRVVDPPPRPHSGLWFMLQASQNQTKEPYLPQVPKSYLRIRDGRTSTVGLLIKYLVNKLKLDSEFEIEITCKGQQLLPFMTLHHVRDNIWHNPRSDAVFSRTSANIDDHLMVLKYGRIA